ncbi:MAG TPA: hypothetical protein DEG71_04500, partial [Clostridiales bacterium]|nr:hypothetical protein [Clostridiales bacterium]
MFISITAPKKGMGQTLCAINLIALLTKYIKGNAILADINKYSNDIEYYFSDTPITKSMDNVVSLIQAELLTKNSFATCVKEVNKNMDILVSNECFEINQDIVQKLVGQINKSYDIGVVDTISGNSQVTKEFLNKSDVIVVVLNQYKNVLDILLENNIYEE